MKLFYTLIVAMVMQLCTFVKTHPSIYFKGVHFTISKVYLNIKLNSSFIVSLLALFSFSLWDS